MANPGLEKVEYHAKELIQVLKDISTVAVSFARMGSWRQEFTPEEFNKIVADFVHDWDVTRRLLRARNILNEPFRADEDVFETIFEKHYHWSVSQRNPPPEYLRSAPTRPPQDGRDADL